MSDISVVAGPRMSRRRILAYGGFGVAAAAVGGVGAIYGLVENGVLPGKYRLAEFMGDCNVAIPPLKYGSHNLSRSGSFYSTYRKRWVGYTIALPPGYGWNQRLPLVICLHGNGHTHRKPLPMGHFPRTPAELVDSRALRPAAFASVDGGDGYWNPHPTDDPFRMLIHEFIPMCRSLGYGIGHRQIGLVGYSMGGFGAMLLTSKRPDLIAAVAVVSPAWWRSYPEAIRADPGSFASQAAWNWADFATDPTRISGIPIRVASSYDDPFYPDVTAICKSLPPSVETVFRPGCHGGDFACSQQDLSLRFVTNRL